MQTAKVSRFFAAASLAAAILIPAGIIAQSNRSSTLSVTQNGNISSATVSLNNPDLHTDGYHPSRVMVRFRDGGNGPSFLPNTANSRALDAANHVYLADTPPGLSVKETIKRYRNNPNVLYAEPDYVVSVVPMPAEYNATTQWDMAKISAEAAWQVHTDSSAVVVAVIDTGIDFSHLDLQPNLYTDTVDTTIHGYNCIGGTCVAGGLDDHGHGTHVAGTIGAAANNGPGMVGINWKVQLLAMKFLNSGGSGSISDAIAAFVKLREMKLAGINIRVTNNSWGGGGYSDLLKNAMAALEEDPPGAPKSTLNVCAAGNSGVNADFSPMYPGAYDNRGIISVLATDSSDTGAGFTNYGLQSVDLAAPGVSTYSTSPLGTCSLCVKTPGAPPYSYLSGTSMASPHVAGVAAALLDMFPNLTAAEARDVMLHPGSYDPMALGSKAQYTSSGGRLNFNKTITNPILNAPIVLNNFPTVIAGPNVVTAGGGTVNITATASDPDGDALRTSTGRSLPSWLFGWQEGNILPATASFTAPLVARTAGLPYDTSVSDNKGGGASGRSWVVVTPGGSPGHAPSGTLTVPPTGTINVDVPITFAATDPDGPGFLGWELWASGNGGSSGWCCFTSSTVNIRFSAAGIYRISVQAMDRELLASPNYTALISIDGAVGNPPIARATLDKESGAAPLTVNIDMTGSTDDGSISNYYIGCGGTFTPGSTAGTGICTFTDPGVYWLLLQVRDNTGLMGLLSKYVVVTPPAGPPPPSDDTVAPTVNITSPTLNANLTKPMNLQATASDNPGGSGVKEVEYYLDSVSPNNSLGKASSAPYTVPWSAPENPGAHTIYAVARDNSGNEGAATPIPVTVTFVAPTITLISPSDGQIVPRKGTVNLTASVGGSFPPSAKGVEYLVNGALVCSSNVSSPNGAVLESFPCAWKAPAAVKSYTVQARVVDDHGNAVSSAIRTIYAR